jgi:hypothetical protein
VVGFTILGEVAIPGDRKAEFQSIFIGRWSEERAPAVDGTEAEAVEGQGER